MSGLVVEDLKVHFGGVRALDGTSLRFRSGGVHALIGPNGAGKTTLINAITGVYGITDGKLLFNGRDIAGFSAHRLARLGITRTFQNLQVFWTMTVLDNVMCGFHLKNYSGFFRSLVRPRSLIKREAELRAQSMEILASVGLEARADQPASTLPYGELKRLEIARALASDPTVLFLDEPVAGCTPAEKQVLADVIRRVADTSRTTIVLVEHDMRVVMSISDFVTVLVRGSVLTEDEPARIRKDARVIDVYLGARRPFEGAVDAPAR